LALKLVLTQANANQLDQRSRCEARQQPAGELEKSFEYLDLELTDTENRMSEDAHEFSPRSRTSTRSNFASPDTTSDVAKLLL